MGDKMKLESEESKTVSDIDCFQMTENNLCGYVYCTTNDLNGKIYIGLHSESEFDTKYLGSGVYLQNAVKQYGKKSFSIMPLVWCFTIQQLNDVEKSLIAKYREALGRENVYNIEDGGYHEGFQGMKKSPETIAKLKSTKQNISPEICKKISDAKKGRPNGKLGSSQTKETKRKIGEANKGTIHSPESIARQKQSVKWYKPSEEMKKRLSISARSSWTAERHAEAKGKPAWNKGTAKPKNTAPKTGRHHSEEHRRKLSEARRKQVPMSNEKKQQIRHTLIARGLIIKNLKVLSSMPAHALI